MLNRFALHDPECADALPTLGAIVPFLQVIPVAECTSLATSAPDRAYSVVRAGKRRRMRTLSFFELNLARKGAQANHVF